MFNKDYKIPLICKMSSYNLYVMKNKGNLKEVAEKWKTEPENVKKEYEQQAKELYENKMKDLREFCKKKNVSMEDLIMSINKANK